MNASKAIKLTHFNYRTWIRIILIVALIIAAIVLLKLPGSEAYGPAPSFTGRIIRVTAASQQEKLQNSNALGTVLLQGSDGYQLQLSVHHATGSGCLGQSALHLTDIHVGQTVTVRYWLTTPETTSNPHSGSAVYIGDRC